VERGRYNLSGGGWLTLLLGGWKGGKRRGAGRTSTKNTEHDRGVFFAGKECGCRKGCAATGKGTGR